MQTTHETTPPQKQAPFGRPCPYRGRTLHDLLDQVAGIDRLIDRLLDEVLSELEREIAGELFARLAHVNADADNCARTRPEYRDSVGYGHLTRLLVDFISVPSAPGQLRLFGKGDAEVPR